MRNCKISLGESGIIIGILCKNKKLDKYVNKFKSIFESYILEERNLSILVLTIRNINLADKNVSGRLISQNEITQVNEVALPSVIYNLSVQYKKRDIRSLRKLINLDEAKLINPSNRLNQLMILQMLSSSELADKYLLPYKSFKKNELDTILNNLNVAILCPKKSTNTRRIIYIKKLGQDYKLCYKDKHQYYNQKDLADYLNYHMKKKNWIHLKLPAENVPTKMPSILRIYLQRGKAGQWEVIEKCDRSYGENGLDQDFITNIVTEPLEITEYINNFIPSLGISFIDFIFIKKRPYLLHLGGWDYRLLRDKYIPIRSQLANNMINYVNYLNNISIERI